MADEIHRILRHEITHGVLKAGSPLIEDEIAERLHVSRSPVRDCMQRLAAEGLIVSRRRRWIVKDHTHDEIVEIYQVRAALEGYAARLAAMHASAEERERILSLSHVDEENPSERVRINDEFHALVIQSARNARLGAACDRNSTLYFDATIAGLYTREDLETSAQQHRSIGDAIARGDADAAARHAREHVEFSMQLLIDKSTRQLSDSALSTGGDSPRSAQFR